jgi:hypothetical protein
MNDNNDVVKESVEPTTQEPSTSSESQSVNNSNEEASTSTSEVVKTQEGESVEELTSQALGEVKAEKSESRVQQLANRAKAAELELQQLRQMQEAQQYNEYGQVATQDPYRDALMVHELKLRRMEENLQFENAARQFPDLLDRNHPDYNPVFDDLVYNTFKNEQVSPIQAAQKVAQIKKMLESKVAIKREQNEAQKVVNSGQVQARSNATYEDTAYNAVKNQFKKSGSVKDLAKMFEIQGR